MNFFKKYNSVIKSLLIIIIILLLVYIFLLNVLFIKDIKENLRVRVRGATRTVTRGTTRTTGSIGGGINQGIDTVGGGVSQGWNDIKDETTEVVGDVTGIVSGFLGDVLTDMKNAINSLSSKFSQINNEINYTQTLSGNFGTNTNNAINDLPLIDTPKSNTSLNNIFKTPSKIVAGPISGGINNPIMSVKPVASGVLTGVTKSIFKKKF